jgi:hypothetical protein
MTATKQLAQETFEDSIEVDRAQEEQEPQAAG